jgi:hypothetical protein
MLFAETATGEFSLPSVDLLFDGRPPSLKIVRRFRQTAQRWRSVRLMLYSKLSPPVTGLDDLPDQGKQALGRG